MALEALKRLYPNSVEALELLREQAKQNKKNNITDSILDATIVRCQREFDTRLAAIMIQKTFRRYSAQLLLEEMSWRQYMDSAPDHYHETQYETYEREREEMIKEYDEFYIGGYEQYELDRIEELERLQERYKLELANI